MKYLGKVLEDFYKEDMENPHLRARHILVIENRKTIAHGTASEIKDNLKDQYDRQIINLDAYFHMVALTI